MSRLLISAMRPFSDRLAIVAATMAGDVSEFKTRSTGPAEYAHAGRSEQFYQKSSESLTIVAIMAGPQAQEWT